MRLFNWARSFEETRTCDDIPKRVRKVEITYWVFIIFFVAILLQGLNTLTNAPEDNLKEHVEGLFWALFGLINIAIMKLWAYIKFTMYFIIWDSKNRVEAEINKLEAEDL